VDSRLGLLTFTPPVTPNYFETMRIPIVEGRALTSFDRAGSKRVAVISKAMARHVWPGQSALGRRLHFPTGSELYEVVGIVKDTTVFQSYICRSIRRTSRLP